MRRINLPLGPHGSTEAILVNGTMISPLLTWDTKITTVNALLGFFFLLSLSPLYPYRRAYFAKIAPITTFAEIAGHATHPYFPRFPQKLLSVTHFLRILRNRPVISTPPFPSFALTSHAWVSSQNNEERDFLLYISPLFSLFLPSRYSYLFIGGITKLTSTFMAKDGVLPRFQYIAQREYSRVFSNLSGEGISSPPSPSSLSPSPFFILPFKIFHLRCQQTKSQQMC
jgi:hypothetical protein